MCARTGIGEGCISGYVSFLTRLLGSSQLASLRTWQLSSSFRKGKSPRILRRIRKLGTRGSPQGYWPCQFGLWRLSGSVTEVRYYFISNAVQLDAFLQCASSRISRIPYSSRLTKFLGQFAVTSGHFGTFGSKKYRTQDMGIKLCIRNSTTGAETVHRIVSQSPRCCTLSCAISAVRKFAALVDFIHYWTAFARDTTIGICKSIWILARF